MVRGRALSLSVAAALAVGACSATPSAQPESTRSARPAGSPSAAASTPPARALAKGESAWVSVAVATLWRTRSSPRPVDAPALASPVRLNRWLGQLSLAQRRALNGRADTQVLFGDRVRVVRLRPHWAKVVVPDQPTPQDARGYPGWVPRRQLTALRPAASTKRVTVTARTAWLRTDTAAASRVLRASFGTRLPYLGVVGRYVLVATPTGEVRRISAAKVAVHAPTEPALPATGRSLVRTAKMFDGLDYLWAGRSGFGFDCSGLTSLVHRVHGITIPRDAAPQAASGRPVRARDRVRGDLLFYATAGVVHHVSMYAGNGLMVHSPRTGSTVEVVSVTTPEYLREYAGARRYRD